MAKTKEVTLDDIRRKWRVQTSSLPTEHKQTIGALLLEHSPDSDPALLLQLAARPELDIFSCQPPVSKNETLGIAYEVNDRLFISEERLTTISRCETSDPVGGLIQQILDNAAKALYEVTKDTRFNPETEWSISNQNSNSASSTYHSMVLPHDISIHGKFPRSYLKCGMVLSLGNTLRPTMGVYGLRYDTEFMLKIVNPAYYKMVCDA